MEAPISASQGAIRSLPGKLESVLSDKGDGLRKGEKNKIRALKSDLEELIDRYLVEPSEVEDSALTASSWMKEVRELSYDIHDFLGELVDVNADAKIQQAPRPKTSWFQVFQEKRKRHQEITDQISSFRNRVKEAIQLHRNHLCNLKKWPSSSAAALDGRLLPPPPLEGGLRLVGMSSSIEELSGWLAKDGNPECKVASIVGVGGVGKTTLANELYIKLGGQFQCRAFVRTTRKPDHRRLLISILSQVRPHQPVDAWGVPNLVEKIKEYLQNKTYFIIIDDLWAPSTWDIVSRALPKGNYCTRILTTTEVEVVARICCAGNSKYIFQKKPLSEEESKELFSNIIYVRQSDQCPKDLSENHEEVIKEIGGLPLAIIIMARLLACQPASIEQWNYMMGLPKSYLIKNANLEMMKHVLNLSYNSIPHYLKACMLYLSLYEEGSIILKDDLVKQWISEGLICAMEGNDKEKAARSYFDELVNRGMIQPVDIDSSDEVLSCTVHYMVLHFIRCLSIEENFITAIDHSQTSTRLADKVRRLALHFGTEEDAKPPMCMRLSQVRSLAFFGSVRCMPSVMQFRLLRVLIFKLWVDPDEASYCNFSGISELFRLRYLRIDACHVNLELPTHMQWLKDLVTLEIEAKVTTVPTDIVDMLGLLHLSLPSEAHLPTGIGNMTSLRSLGYFDLSSNSEENVMDLGKLTNLQDLHLTCSTEQPPDNLEKSMECLGLILKKLSNLKCVTLVPASSSDVNTHDDTGASSISISCNLLSSITPASAYLQRFEFPRFCIFHNLPKWFAELHQLCILKIAVREISTEDIRILKALPALTALSLSVWSVPEGWIFIEEGAFPALRYFKFTCAAPCLAFVEGAMSDVQRLKLRFNSNRLEQYNPADAGFKYLSGLKEIYVELGGAGADKTDMRAVESALLDAFKKHRSTLIINLQRVQLIYHGDKEMDTSLQKKNYQTLPVKGMMTDEQHGRTNKQVDSRTSMPLESISHLQNPGRDRSITTQQGKHHILIKQGDMEDESNEEHEIQDKLPAEDIIMEVDFGTSAASESSLSLQNQGLAMELAMLAICPLLPKLGELLAGEFTLEKRVRKGVDTLDKELKLMHAALGKVARVPPEELDDGVKIWAGMVRDLACQMEDIVDAFVLRVGNGSANPKNRVKKLLKKTSRLFKKGKDLHQISDAIEEAVLQAKQLAEMHQRYELETQDAGAEASVDPRIMAMYTDVTELVGIEEPRDELINMLLDGDNWSKNPLKMVSVVGFGGLGKTTLAKTVYDKIKVQFDCCAFVLVSQNPNMKKILKDILFELDKVKYSDIYNVEREEMHLINELIEFLDGKRYLMVIDDTWDEKAWQLIKCAFSKNNIGSRLIMTTRNVSVAETCCSSSHDIYHMKPLCEDVSRRLFYKRIFSHEKDCPHELVEVSEHILKKCGGIPLAIITIASLLSNNCRMKTKDQWDAVLHSIGRGLTEDRNVKEMKKILLFSYYNLPSYLKPCLLYLSIFPEDHLIMRVQLILKWISEGFIYSEDEETSLYELGDSYFNELVNRSIIQPIGIDEEGKVQACRVHDMVLDLICTLASEENFVTILNGTKRKITDSQSKVRRLSIQNSNVEVATISMAQVRSLSVFTNDDVDQLYKVSSCQVLRVLDLEYCPSPDTWNFLHLRQLRLKGYKGKELPMEIGQLLFLQILDISGTSIKEIPSSVVGLGRLMYLHLGWLGVKLPSGIDNLTCLEVLQGLTVGKQEGYSDSCNLHLVKELGNLTKLRVLELLWGVLDESMAKTLVESLSNLHKLQALDIHGDQGGHVNLMHEGWVPSQQLRRVFITGCSLWTLPAWINPSSLPLLSYLVITVSKVRRQDIPLLGMLRALRYLSLSVDGYWSSGKLLVEAEMEKSVVTADAFPCAEVCFVGGIAIAPSIFPGGAAPRLKELYFSFPASWISRGDINLSMGHLPSLKEVMVDLWRREASDGVVEEAAAALKAAAEDHPNRPRIRINTRQ